MTFEQFQHRLLWNMRFYLSLRPYLGLLEQVRLQKVNQSDKPQLFILGLPRSGTTLVYQYIVHRLDIAYFTNKAGDYYLSPYFVTNWQRRQLGTYQSDFKNSYGKVTGSLSPREAGAIWGRFFGTEDYIEIEAVSSKKIQTLQDTVAGVQYLFGDLPFVNKNVKHMLRIHALSKIFPNACFLVVERDLSAVALSVLRGRYANLENPMQWWSVKPPNYLELKDLPIIEQVFGQLLSLQEKMTSDFSQIFPERIIHLNYLDFCRDPESVITSIRRVLGELPYRNVAERCFEPSIKSPQNDEEMKLVELVKQYERTR